MKTKSLLIISISSLFLCSCVGQVIINNGLLTTSEESSSQSESSSNSSTTSGGGTESSSSEGSSSSSESSSSEPEEQVVDLGIKTISEIKTLCNEYVLDVNQSGIGINYNYKVTLKATSVDYFDLVKSMAGYGLDISSPSKSLFADSTGYIAVAGSNLFSSVNDYAHQRTSGYTITGYLSKYLNKPELYVPDKNYAYDKNLSIPFNMYDSAVESNVSVASLFEHFVDMPYNCSGYGYDEVYSLNNIKILSNPESNQYVATDGYRMLKVLSYKNRISVGSIYKIAGLITTANWQPAIRVLAETRVLDEAIINNFPTEYKTARPMTITQCKANISSNSKESTNRMDSFIASFQYLYKANAYVNYYVKSSKAFITLCDEYHNFSTDINETQAHNTYKMVDLENPSCWGISSDADWTRCILKPYCELNESFEFYYTLWQTDRLSEKLCWKVFVMDDMLPEISSGD